MLLLNDEESVDVYDQIRENSNAMQWMRRKGKGTRM